MPSKQHEQRKQDLFNHLDHKLSGCIVCEFGEGRDNHAPTHRGSHREPSQQILWPCEQMHSGVDRIIRYLGGGALPAVLETVAVAVVERLWRSIRGGGKLVAEARNWDNAYLEFYNRQRPHQVGYRTPAEVSEEAAIGLGETAGGSLNLALVLMGPGPLQPPRPQAERVIVCEFRAHVGGATGSPLSRYCGRADALSGSSDTWEAALCRLCLRR